MSLPQDQSKLSNDKKQALLLDRLAVLFSMSPTEAQSTAQKLFNHYEKLGCFPKTQSTLDVSIKVLVNLWKNPKATTSNAPSLRP